MMVKGCVRRRVKDVIFTLLDNNLLLRAEVLSDVEGAKRELQLKTEAVMVRTVNPETVSRRVREYKALARC